MQKLKSLKLFVVSLNLILSSCALKPPDAVVCTRVDFNRGWCTHTISDKEFYIDDQHPYEGKTWWEWMPYMVYLPPPTWEKVKTFIIKTCQKNPKQCDQEISNWERKTYQIDKNIAP